MLLLLLYHVIRGVRFYTGCPVQQQEQQQEQQQRQQQQGQQQQGQQQQGQQQQLGLCLCVCVLQVQLHASTVYCSSSFTSSVSRSAAFNKQAAAGYPCRVAA